MSYLTHNRIVILIASLFMSANAGAMHHGKGLKPPINLAQLEEQASARFNEADLDGDGLLSKTEFAEADLPMQPARSGWRGNGKKQRKQHADATPEEREAQLESRRERFAEANPEQAAQREQMRAAMEAELFKLMDTNADGQVDPEELSQADKRALRAQAPATLAAQILSKLPDQPKPHTLLWRELLSLFPKDRAWIPAASALVPLLLGFVLGLNNASFAADDQEDYYLWIFADKLEQATFDTSPPSSVIAEDQTP